MIVAATGHRPDKIGGYDYYAPQRVWIREQMRKALVDLQADRTISGMALGVDQDFAQVSIELAIPFIAALPFIGQESRWPKSSQDYYEWLLERADEVVVISPGEYAAYKMQVRNKWLVDNSDALVSVWDGSPGGTANCMTYAKDINALVYPIDPKEFIGGYRL
jgi:uncharacterized phage-like protein YoqJ